jgi:hypothetical protein
MSFPSRILLSVFLLTGVFFLYLTWYNDEKYAVYIIPCVLGVVATFMLSPQVDWLWFKKNTPELPESLRKMLFTCSPSYENLTAAKKDLYRKRIYLFMIGNDFSGMAGFSEAIPEDIKFAVSAQATLLTLNLEDFLFPKCEKVIVYPHRFPSPLYMDRFHASELYEEDGCFLFDAELVLRSMIEPRRLFNPVLYEYYKAYRLTYPEKAYPEITDMDIELGIQISCFDQTQLEETIGLTNLDQAAILSTYYFVFEERFRKINPTLFDKFDAIFELYR